MAERTARHDPVMLAEVLRSLQLKPGDLFVDGTLGLGGHSREVWPRIAPSGRIVGFDWDADMMAIARENLAGANVEFVNADFREIPNRVTEPANGILLDFGLNSAQIDDASRGISFLNDGPLDMRMNRQSGETAASLLNRWTPGQIERVLRELGDERWAKRIAEKVVERRRDKPLRTTHDLVECVLAAIPVAARDKRIHPATRTFQAIRLATTGELDRLEESLVEIASALAPGGTLVTLSYHSGEDRAAKHAFRVLSGAGFEDLFPKPLQPTESEVSSNPRSRSAKLRAIRRNPSAG